MFKKSAKIIIQQMDRGQKETMLKPWMRDSMKGDSTAKTMIDLLNHLIGWRNWTMEQRHEELKKLRVQLSHCPVPWLQKFCEKINIYDQTNDSGVLVNTDGLEILTDILSGEINSFFTIQSHLHLDQEYISKQCLN